MSNYPDNFDAAAHNARYARADCLVDDWHKSEEAIRMARRGLEFQDANDDAGYWAAIAELDHMRLQALDDCGCGRCADSENWATDGESLINHATASA